MKKMKEIFNIETQKYIIGIIVNEEIARHFYVLNFKNKSIVHTTVEAYRPFKFI